MTQQTSPSASDQTRWAGGINILVGIWLLISPWVLGFTATNAALWDDVVLGIAIIVVAAIRLGWAQDQTWLSWLNLILGAWVVISPWVLGFSSDTTAMWDNVITGIVAFIVAGWAALAVPGGVSRNLRRGV
jgi:hypothetical protein